MKNILVINAGSSSLKYQLIDMDTENVVAKGIAERIGIEGSNLVQKAGGKKYTITRPMQNHTEAIHAVMEALMQDENADIKSMDEIQAVGHRVVHGGEKFSKSALINAEVMAAIEENIPLAPLHNPPNIMGIKACMEAIHGVPHVAVFDTAFHQTMPQRAFLYGLPYDYYTDKKIRRYGFHGTSHKYVAEEAAKRVGKPIEELKIVTCHLGNGSSIAAVQGGKCVDTTMGLTPLEGLVMGTRSGDLDPAIIEYLMKHEHLSIDEVMAVLNKKSGMLGLSGVSSDMRDITDAYYENNPRAILAFEVYGYRIRKYIGAYAAAMGGLDVIVFTAGVGENDDLVRKYSMEGLEYLGARIDHDKNKGHRGDADLTLPGSTVKTLIVATDEELAIARDTVALIAS